MTNETKRNPLKNFLINDEWQVKRDYNGNHQPERFRAVTNKGVTTDKWVAMPNYFSTLSQAMQHIIDVEVYEGMPPCVEVVDAMAAYKRITSIFSEALIRVS
jgi:hypothetical protein